MPRGLLKIIHITGSLDNLTETFIQGFVKEVDKLESIDLKVYTLERMKMKSSLRNPVTFIETSRFSKLKTKISSFLNIKTTLRNRLFEYGISEGVYNSTQIIFVDFSVNFVNIFNRVDKFEKPVFVFLHGYDASKVFRSVQFKNKFQQLGIKKNVYFVSPCDYFLNRFKVNFGFNSSNLLKLPYGVDIKEHFTMAPSSHREICTLMFVGRFVEKKNPLALIEMLNYVVNEMFKNNIQLVLIGDGPLMLEVRKRVKKYSLEKNVIFRGALPHEIVKQELRCATIYVQHSVTDSEGDQEGLPNSIIEAMSNGIPVVSTIHSGIPELIINGYNGFLVQELDYCAMGDRVLNLIEDNSLYERVSENAFKSARELLWSNNERSKALIDLVRNHFTV